MKHSLLIGSIVWFCITTAFSQDRICWGDQNLDKIGSVNASDLGSSLAPVSIQNPSGMAYYHTKDGNQNKKWCRPEKVLERITANPTAFLFLTSRIHGLSPWSDL